MQGLTKLEAGRGHVALAERPEPVAGPGQVVLEVQAAGICGTDLHIEDGEFRSWPPVTMGHEVCGAVTDVGEGVNTEWKGARVVTETYFSTCGVCAHCRGGRTNLCLDRRSIGSAVDGGFAPYVLVPERNVHQVPDRLTSAAASLAEPLACVCNCLRDQELIGRDDCVLVVGPGPVGLLAAQVAAARGGRVHVRGTAGDAVRLAKAAELGFETSVVGEEAPTADVVIECSGSAAGIAFGIEKSRRGGRFVQIGLAGKPVSIPFDELCYRELTVTSGNAATPESWEGALALIEAEEIELESLVTAVVPLEEWARAFAATRAGDGIKYVLDPRLSARKA